MAFLPYQPKKTRFAEILLAIKAQIINYGVATAGMVQIIATDAPPMPMADKLVYLRPRRHIAAQAQLESAGRIDLRLTRQLDIFLKDRAALDKTNSDEILLTDINRGLFDLEENVIGALQDFAPVDGDQNELLVYPMRITAGSQPDKDAQNIGWGQSSSTWEIVYMPPLDLIGLSPDSLPVGVAGDAYSAGISASPDEDLPL